MQGHVSPHYGTLALQQMGWKGGGFVCGVSLRGSRTSAMPRDGHRWGSECLYVCLGGEGTHHLLSWGQQLSQLPDEPTCLGISMAFLSLTLRTKL